jgi:hypothetical protein
LLERVALLLPVPITPPSSSRSSPSVSSTMATISHALLLRL